MTAAPATHVVPSATIEWPTSETPSSPIHDDIYWSRDAGLAEKHHVFVAGNALPDRFSNLDRQHFTIVEIGFGFGLNFLLAANQWRRANPTASILNYVAIERAPVALPDLERLYEALVPTLRSIELLDPAQFRQHVDQLAHRYPTPYPGAQTIWIDRDISLTLVIGEVATEIDNLDLEADAWFLDGFSPSRNQDAWTGQLFHRMALSSRPGATFSTYSVAGDVRRGLAASGFEIERRPGFGQKAEMLGGYLPGHWQAQTFRVQKVAVIGGGIAGLSCADALARRAIDTTLYDAARPLAGASGLPMLAVQPQLAVRPHVGSLFSLAAFQYTARFDNLLRPIGRLTLADTNDAALRLERIAGTFPDSLARFVRAGDAPELPQTQKPFTGMTFDAAGCLNPGEMLSRLDASKVTTQQQKVAGVQGGKVTLDDGSVETFDAVIIATGSSALPQTAPFEFEPVRGQAISVRIPGLGLNCVIGGPVYVIPEGDDRYTVGATYDKDDIDTAAREEDTQSLLRKLKSVFVDEAEVVAAHVGIRCTTRDRAPVMGALPDWKALDRYCEQGGPAGTFNGYESSTFVCTGFGSHGGTHALLCAEALVRQVTGEASCIGRRWRQRLDPARFKIRQARRAD